MSAAVRLATLDDVTALIALGESFYRDDGTRTACRTQLARFAVDHICEPGHVCLVAGDPIAAVICGVMKPHYFTSEATAFKTAWYAAPGAKGHGRRLLAALESWAREQGARRLIVSGRAPRTLELLRKLDFHSLETVTTKDLLP